MIIASVLILFAIWVVTWVVIRGAYHSMRDERDRSLPRTLPDEDI